jgi:hypothetical protein
MIIPKSKSTAPEPKTITLADGQTFTVLVAKPTFQQRFADEGREVLAYGGRTEDAWPEYRLGRIRDAIVDWQDVTNDKDQAIPFTAARLFTLMEAAPEIVTQVTAIANEAFRPLVLMPPSPEPPATSGEATETEAASATNSDSTSTAGESADSQKQPESPPAS